MVEKYKLASGLNTELVQSADENLMLNNFCDQNFESNSNSEIETYSKKDHHSLKELASPFLQRLKNHLQFPQRVYIGKEINNFFKVGHGYEKSFLLFSLKETFSFLVILIFLYKNALSVFPRFAIHIYSDTWILQIEQFE